MATTESQRRPRSTGRVRGVLLGSDRRLGLWILPLFLMTALLGATLAGALAVLYYGQRVTQLEAATAGARAELDAAVERVTATAEEAEAAIAEEVRRVQEALAAGPPVERLSDAGVYAVAAEHPGGEVRVGSAFAVLSDPSETALLTTYRLVATRDGFALPTAEVFLPDGPFQATVHNYDADLDLAVLRLRGGPLPVADWRPADPALERGDRVWLLGVAGPGSGAVLDGVAAAVSADAVVSTILVNDFVAGGPLVDAQGRVVAIASLDYAPFGRVGGELTYAVPIRAVCQRLVRCTAEDLGVERVGDPAPPPPVEEPAPVTPEGEPPPDGGEHP